MERDVQKDIDGEKDRQKERYVVIDRVGWRERLTEIERARERERDRER